MYRKEFSPGEKIKIFNKEKIRKIFPYNHECQDVIENVEKWAGSILTFSKYGIWYSIYTEEADTTFHIDIIEKLPLKIPEHLFQIEE